MSTNTRHARTAPGHAVRSPGGPSDLNGVRPASNPDGKTPAELPGKSKSLHDQSTSGAEAPRSESPSKKGPSGKH